MSGFASISSKVGGSVSSPTDIPKKELSLEKVSFGLSGESWVNITGPPLKYIYLDAYYY